MQIYEAIKKRRSIRKFKQGDVPEDALNRILEAARLAPSACNRQAWKLIVVRDRATIGKLSGAARAAAPGPNNDVVVWQDIINTPVIIAGCILVKDANMRYFQQGEENPVMFTNQGRGPHTAEFWQEYVEHSRTHKGDYESMGVWDLAIAMDHITLAAMEEGLATCWIGGADETMFREILSVPDDVQVRMLMRVGLGDIEPEMPRKKPMSELVCYEKYS